MITLRTGSHALNIITLLSVTGEFPMRSLKLLGNERVLKALVHKMTTPQDYRLPHTQTEERITCKLLNVSGKGSSKSIRFSKAALPILEWIHPDAYDYYMHSFWDHKFPGDAAHIERNHRVAESVMMCMAAGIECRPYSLPSLQNMQISLTVPEYSAYYLAKDLKKLGDSEMSKTVFTRMAGAIFSQSEAYAVYNTRNALMKWNGTDRDGNNILYEGVCAEARIVSVIRAGIFVDLFGLEIYIPLRELSYQRLLDASSQFQPGQRVLVKILSIDRSDRNHIKASASVKQAGENPYEKALRRFSVGNRYVGTVSMVDTTGVFVALDGGVDCLCSYPKRGRPPRGARVTVRILGLNMESNRIWGAITHIAAPR